VCRPCQCPDQRPSIAPPVAPSRICHTVLSSCVNPSLLMQVQDVYSPWVIPTLVFLVLVVFGSFFLLKLLLAVIWDKFASVQAQIDISKEAEALRDNLTLVSTDGRGGGGEGAGGGRRCHAQTVSWMALNGAISTPLAAMSELCARVESLLCLSACLLAPLLA
jgi:hypothetical protein